MHQPQDKIRPRHSSTLPQSRAMPAVSRSPSTPPPIPPLYLLVRHPKRVVATGRKILITGARNWLFLSSPPSVTAGTLIFLLQKNDRIIIRHNQLRITLSLPSSATPKGP